MKYDRKLLFSGQDEYGPVEVVESNELRSLHFGTLFKQSEMDLKDPFTLVTKYIQLMAMSLVFSPQPKSVLVLGLGGGSLPKFIWKHFPKCRIDAIERSPLVAKISHEYFAVPKSPRLNIHIDDAFEYVRQSHSTYDLIFVDLFLADSVADLPSAKDFFKNCHRLLTHKNSLILLHVWRNTPQAVMVKVVQQIVEEFGKNLLILPDEHGGSHVFFIFSQIQENTSTFELAQRAGELKEKTGIDFLQKLINLNCLKDYGFLFQD